MDNIMREEIAGKGVFKIYEEGYFAGEMSYYFKNDNTIVIDHTKVKEVFGGKGVAKKLVMRGIAYAREKKLKIIPVCSYVQHRFDQDEEIRDVLSDEEA